MEAEHRVRGQRDPQSDRVEVFVSSTLRLLIDHGLRVVVGITCVFGSVGASAQTSTDDPFDVLDEERGAIDPSRPWVGWHGPFVDGLIDLRFGMDRFTVLRLARDRGFEGTPASDDELRFEGTLLGETVEVRLTFTSRSGETDGSAEIAPGQLRRIQVTWRLTGLPQRPLRLFERLDDLMRKRYGEPVLTLDDGFAALDVGKGTVRSLYVGPEARAQVELQAYRPERYYVVVALTNPQLSGEGGF